MTEVFTIAPGSSKALWIIAAISPLLFALLLLFAFFVYSSRATRFELIAEGLAIRRTLYGRTIAWSSLEVEQARIVNLRDSYDLQPTLRTNGLGLPGYQAGWFRLRREGKGLLFVTDPSRVVALPTREGFTLLLSVRDPAGFAEALRRAAARPPRDDDV